MKKLFGVCLTVAFLLTLSFGSANAIMVEGKKLTGKHWQFNIIGHPNSISGDHSGGRALMVPLDNVKSRIDELTCPEDTDARFVDDLEPMYYTMDPAKGVKIFFEASGDPNRFEIVDRDATDGEARILIPSDLGDNPMYNEDACLACEELPSNSDEQDFCEAKYCSLKQDVIAVNVVVRVLGKPNTCMNINGYAYDDFQQLYFWSGRIELARKPGKATWVNVDDIFYVNWCEVDDLGACMQNTNVELSVFHDVFSTYFWDVLNDGTRLVQVRLYPVTSQEPE
jgi:hypothetical protein